ncbi:hypothetical protein HMPREF9539_03884 [Escherichia coli MS 110-3]|nr:hypothetical protein HMPREF9539_03884 [Escherichia coli MS 110-3]
MRLWGDSHKHRMVFWMLDRFHNPLFIVLMAVKKSLIIKNLSIIILIITFEFNKI